MATLSLNRTVKKTVKVSKGNVGNKGVSVYKTNQIVGTTETGLYRKTAKAGAFDKAISVPVSQRNVKTTSSIDFANEQKKARKAMVKGTIKCQVKNNSKQMKQRREDVKSLTKMQPIHKDAQNFNKGIDNPKGHQGEFISDMPTNVKDNSKTWRDIPRNPTPAKETNKYLLQYPTK